MSHPSTPYLHGFSPEEQARLRAQARFAEQTVYEGVDFSQAKKIIEVGCGVGAQTEILLRRFPDLHITGVDLNPVQLKAAREHLEKLQLAENRVELFEMSATDLQFQAHTFDGAFLCWILEHLKEPTRVLSEVRRVLRPGAKVVATEVMNSSFFLEPYSKAMWKYWMAFNDFQFEQTGDPFVGAKLGNLLHSVGFREVKTSVKTWHYDNREPSKRREAIRYWSDLLLSAADILIANGRVDDATVREMREELRVVSVDPNAVFFYSFIQAEGISL